MLKGASLYVICTLAALLAAASIYGKLQHDRGDRIKAEFASFRGAVQTAADAEALRQHAVNATVAAAAKERGEDRAAAAAERDKEIAAYEVELGTNKAAACVFDERDVIRLRSILR